MTHGKIAKRDVLVVKDGATTGKTGFVSDTFPFSEAAVNEHVFILRIFEGLTEPKYLFYWMQSSFGQDCVRENFQGTAQGGINTTFVKNSSYPLPPFHEQIRIVAKLEELFARLDAGVEGLRKVKAQLKRYRQAVLKYAFEGKLTEKWRKNHRDLIEPASQLVKSIIKGNLAEWENDQLLQVKKSRQDQKNDLLKKKYKQPLLPSTSTQAGLPEYWAWVTADQLFWSITSGSRGWAKYYSEEGAFFVRVGDLSHDNISINLKSAQHVNPPDGAELRRTRVSSGDILISITADVGRIALVPIGVKEAYINQHVALAKSVPLFSHSYLAWFLLSPLGQKQLTDLQYGATKAGLGLDDIGRVNVPLAPLVEQYEIVEEIERRLSVLTETEKVIEQNLRRANSLRQSILRTAFEGRLVPQDPEDEPADKLLECIQEERAKSMGEKNTNKRRKNKPRQLELSTYVK
jgi:type I restriction enzyme S subunit